MRGVWQAFAGSLYITGASGDSPDIAAQELVNQYEVAEGTPIKVNGYKEPSSILAPEPDATFEEQRESFKCKYTTRP